MKKKNILGLIITLLLVILGIVSVGISLSVATSTLSSVIKFIVYGVIISYILYDFSSPHGNMFKYIMLLFGFSLASSVNNLIMVIKNTEIKTQAVNTEVPVFLCIFAAVLIGYMSGRLNKFKKNVCTMSIIALLLLAAAITSVIGIETDKSVALIIAGAFSDVLAWFSLCSAYVTRFNDHKEAGEAADKESK